jgi:hypothetical protein
VSEADGRTHVDILGVGGDALAHATREAEQQRDVVGAAEGGVLA